MHADASAPALVGACPKPNYVNVNHVFVMIVNATTTVNVAEENALAVLRFNIVPLNLE